MKAESGSRGSRAREDRRVVAAVTHGEVPPDAPEDERDVLVEVECVCKALERLGYRAETVPFALDLGKGIERLRGLRPAFAFNLVESLGGSGCYLHMAAEAMEYLGVPFTGSGSSALYLSTDKVLSKTVLSYHRVPTPAWRTVGELGRGLPPPPFPVILKPIAEDASVGIDDRSVFGNAAGLDEALGRITQPERDALFVESYIDGREFNLSLVESEDGVEVLPPAEIIFKDYPRGKPRIVGYEAKWDQGSFAFSHTPRTFTFAEKDQPLLDRVKTLAVESWHACGLGGYARVDFRVDRKGRPWVLEANANPCISPDSGFVAAAFAAGYSGYDQIVERIVARTVSGRDPVWSSTPCGSEAKPFPVT